MRHFSLASRLIAATLLIGTLAASSFAASPAFSDIGSIRYPTAIAILKDGGIIGGYADGTFRPDATVNRAEFLKILVASKTTDYGTGSGCFSDVGSEWFAPFVCYAKTQGWVGGYPDGTFRPSQTITLVETLKITLEAMKPFSTMPYDPGEVWYLKYLSAALGQSFVPEDVTMLDTPLTRAQMAETIYRVRLFKNDYLAYLTYKTDNHLALRTAADFGTTSAPVASSTAGTKWYCQALYGGVYGTELSITNTCQDYATDNYTCVTVEAESADCTVGDLKGTPKDGRCWFAVGSGGLTPIGACNLSDVTMQFDESKCGGDICRPIR